MVDGAGALSTKLCIDTNLRATLLVSTVETRHTADSNIVLKAPFHILLH